MGNTIFLNHDKQFGEIIMEGDQTSEDMTKFIAEAIKLDNQLSNSFGKVDILVDLSKLGRFDTESQITTTKAIKTVSFDRAAVIGASPENRKLVDMMVGLAGKQVRVQFFPDRVAAETWLAT